MTGSAISRQQWFHSSNWQHWLILISATTLLCGAAGMMVTDPPSSNMKSRTEPNFHTVLERIGKTVLRPGGNSATERLLNSAHLSPGDSVIDLAAGVGSTSILLAENYGCKVLMVELDEERLKKGADRAKARGLKDRIRIKKADMFRMDEELATEEHNQFDCAIEEGALLFFPYSRKVKFFEGISKYTKRFLLHDICLTANDQKIQNQTRKEMSRVLNIGWFPETVDNWQKLLKDAGFTIDYVETGSINLLNPLNMIKDEGPINTARIFANVVTQPYVRKRLFAARQALASNKDSMGYIIINASKQQQ